MNYRSSLSFSRNGAARARVILAAFAILLIQGPARAESDYADSTLEIGLERLWAAAPAENAAFSGLLLNWYFSPYTFIGTSQSALTFRRQTEYRPDFHFGLLFPFVGPVSIETTVGVDFFTALIIALAMIDDDSSEIDYKFVSSFYTPYFTLGGALRIDLAPIAIRLLSQIQFGGYLQNETSGFNASLWLGAGVSYRFAF